MFFGQVRSWLPHLPRNFRFLFMWGVVLASFQRKFHQNHDDKEQGYEDYRHDESPDSRPGTDYLIFACRAGRGHSRKTGHQETSPLERGCGQSSNLWIRRSGRGSVVSGDRLIIRVGVWGDYLEISPTSRCPAPRG